MTPEFYQKILATYPDARAENIWASLFLMTDLMTESAGIIADRLNFSYNEAEGKNVIDYLLGVKLRSNSETI